MRLVAHGYRLIRKRPCLFADTDGVFTCHIRIHTHGDRVIVRFTAQPDSNRPFACFNAAAQRYRFHTGFGTVTDDGGVFADFTVAADNNAVRIVGVGITADSHYIRASRVFCPYSYPGSYRHVILSLYLYFISHSDRVMTRFGIGGGACFRFITDSNSICISGHTLITDRDAILFQRRRLRTDSNLIGVLQFFRRSRIRFPTDSNVTLGSGPSICPQSRRVLFHRHGFSTDSNNSIDDRFGCISYTGPCFRAYKNSIITWIFYGAIVIIRINFNLFLFLPYNTTILIYIFPYFYFILFINADRDIMDLSVIWRILCGNHIGRQKSASQKGKHHKTGKHTLSGF